MKTQNIYYVLLGLAFVACASKVTTENRKPATVEPQNFLFNFDIDREAGEVYQPDGTPESERQEYQKLINLFSNHFKNKYSTEQLRSEHQDQHESGYALRGVHAKGHGCLTGTFNIIDHGQPEFQFGIFKEPKSFDAIIRVSNGDGPPQSDKDKKVSIGMAFKVLDVKNEKLLGEKQKENSADFLMTNHPNFIVKNIQDFVKVIEGRENGLWAKIETLTVAAKGFLQRLKVNKNDPLTTFYWSNLPFKIGDTTVKYLMRPEICKGDKDLGDVKVTTKMRKDPNFLSEALSTHIRNHSACYGFYLQKKVSGPQSPIENATVIWPEENVLTRVAELVLPVQEPNEKLLQLGQLKRSSLTGKQICQNLSFSPWNTTKDFKPLSSLNRARRVIYELSTAFRRDINNAVNPAE